MRCKLALVLIVILVSGCQMGDDPLTGPQSLPDLAISDGAQQNGNPHFFFLPPMVPEPLSGGAFDPSLAPVVSICEWNGISCEIPLLAEYTMSSGVGSELVRVSLEDEHYIVNWHTRDFNLDAEKTYRIEVHVGGATLGFADVDVVDSGKQLKNVNTDEFIPLKDGRTLPIKFRIEEGALIPTLLFRSERDGNPEIYTINEDGTAFTRITFNGSVDQLPVWSPDRSLIAFVSQRDGNGEIYVMNGDGSGQVNLTNNAASDGGTPAWSPDGSKLAFSSTRDGVIGGTGARPSQDIYIMDRDGGNVNRLTADAGDDGGPSWSPDGSTIAFASSRDKVWPEFEIYLMDTDGANLRRITFASGYSIDPSWSPDGTRIAFVSNRPGSFGPDDVWVMNADGSNPINLTASSADVQGGGGRVSWSPDGSRLAFSSNQDGNWEVYTMNAIDGSDVVRVTANPSDDLQPSWRP